MPPRKRTGIMLAKPFEQHLLDKMPEQVLFQPKLDGVRVTAIWYKDTYKLFSSTCLPVNSVPHIVKALNDMADATGGYEMFDGEVFAPNLKLQHIMSIVSKTTCIDRYHWMVAYHIFDIMDDRPQEPRSLDLLSSDTQAFAASNDAIKIVPTFLSDKTNWQYYVSTFVDMGYEGAIIRDPRAPYTYGKVGTILKIKPQQSDTYKIAGCQQAISISGEPKGMVGAFDLIDSLGNRFQAGAGRLDHQQRTYWWRHRGELPGMLCVVKYLALTERGVPREPVTMEIKEANASNG